MKKGFIKKYGIITLGVILEAISLQYFYYPNKIINGGVSGLALILSDYIPVSPGMFMNISNVVLFILAYFLIGKKIVIDSIYASFALSLILLLMEKFISSYSVTNNQLLVTIFGGAVGALGMALSFNEGSSTGGTSIIAMIMNKLMHIDIGKALLIADGVVVVMAIFSYGTERGLYGLLSCIVTGLLTDNFIEGFNNCKQVMIISKKTEEIENFIINKIDRSCTKIMAKGSYSNEEIEIIYVVVHRKQFIALKKAMMGIDKDAFITVSEAREVLGEGFSDLE
ncbi:MAG: YitT family protein [Sarcina sp.]